MTANATSTSESQARGRKAPLARLLPKLLLLVGTLGLAVGLLEVGLRLGGYGPATHLRWSAHPELHYTPTPNQEGTVRVSDDGAGDRTIHMQINGYGQRSVDYPLEKEAGEFRVVVLGDSLTFGPGVSNEETFVVLAEGLLNEARASNEAGFTRLINTGANGWSTIHYLRWMETQLEVYSPDLVVMGLFIGNDQLISKRNNLFNPVPFPGLVRNSAIGHYLLENHRQALKKMAEAMAPEGDKNRLLEPIDKSLRAFVGKPADELGSDENIRLWRHAMEHVLRMKELADAADTRFVCLLIPEALMVSREGDFPMHGWLRRNLRAAGVPVILPDAELRPLGLAGWHSYDQGHLNVAGHAAVGRALSQGLRDLRDVK